MIWTILGIGLLLCGAYILAAERGWLRKQDINGKHIFLTGAGSGLGRGMAIAFAKLGANLTLCDINVQGLEETKVLIKKETGRDDNIFNLKLDVSDRPMIADVAKQCKAKFGDVQIIINNAGIVQGKQILDLNEKMTSLGFKVNVESHIWIIREFLDAMMKKNEGQVVSVASMAGLAGNAYLTDYCAQKFGAIGLNEALRIEMKHNKKNIVCTTIQPYIINTGMFEGAKASVIFPFLEQDYVIRRMVDAILQREEDVTIPWSQGMLAHLSKALFPASVIDQLIWLLMGWDSMKGFTGRKPTPGSKKNN